MDLMVFDYWVAMIDEILNERLGPTPLRRQLGVESYASAVRSVLDCLLRHAVINGRGILRAWDPYIHFFSQHNV
jgi:hypothetical protein